MTENITGAEDVLWDLSDLYTSTEDERFLHDVGTLVSRAESFRAMWHGRIAKASADELATMIAEYAAIVEVMDGLGSFVYLLWSTDTERSEFGKSLQLVRETSAAAWTSMVFVAIEIGQIADEHYAALQQSAGLAPYLHWIERSREYRAYMLPENVEQVLTEKSLTARGAWVRLHDELFASQVFTLDGKQYSEAAILKLLHDKDRNVRKAAAESLSKGLREGARTQAFIFNTVVADHAMNDRIRGYKTWVSSRNLDNEVSDTSVQALVDAVVGRYDLVQRLYELKKRILGYDVMYDYDRYAPVADTEDTKTWAQARELVLDAYKSFHPESGEIVQMFFDNNWIHAPVTRGKNGGAYSASTIPSAHPYVFMNYTGTSRDVQVLAHELGHGVHQYLSREQGVLLMHTPLTIAETASVFGEMITFQKILDTTASKNERLALLVSKLDDITSTVFRQISLNRFEHAMHTARREEGELSVDRLNELWMTTQTQQFGNTVTYTDGYKHWWSYISHFMHTPGYVYAYAFGELLVLALYEIYQRTPDTFPALYMNLLRSGGSASPEALLAPFGININDPQFWNVGLDVIEKLLEQAEGLAP